MKKKEELGNLSQLSREELVKRCREMSEELMRLRFRKSSGQLDKAHLLRSVRRNLARGLTMLQKRFPRSARSEQVAK
ncbi:MAG: 50S ribosomal protein L29 [Bdellovibrionota bacterium]|nr:MAG: 50S ribosomal protein L29 [Bdellovibrionota bacterium]